MEDKKGGHKHKEGKEEDKKAVHETEAVEAKIKIKKVSVWKIATLVLGIALIVSLYMNFRGESAPLSKEEVAEKSVAFLNKNVLAGTTAVLKSVEEDNGLYKLILDIGGREYESYATKDGRLLFPSVIDLEAEPETAQQPPQQQIEYPKTDKPDVLVFTMSYCPYGNQAEKGLKPVAELLGEKANIEPHYVIYANYGGGGPDYCFDEENKYCSMHGIAELNQGIRELCIYKHQKDKFWSYIGIVNDKCSLANIETCWKEAAEQADVDIGNINTCFEGEALELLKTEAELNQKYGVGGSPTILINEQSYSGARTPEAYKTAICSAFSEAPDECGQTLSGEGAAASGQC